MSATRFMTATALCGPESDDRGLCPRHPSVQMQRFSHRTGLWLTLLDECPLCRIDDKEGRRGGVSSMAQSRQIKSEPLHQLDFQTPDTSRDDPTSLPFPRALLTNSERMRDPSPIRSSKSAGLVRFQSLNDKSSKEQHLRSVSSLSNGSDSDDESCHSNYSLQVQDGSNGKGTRLASFAGDFTRSEPSNVNCLASFAGDFTRSEPSNVNCLSSFADDFTRSEPSNVNCVASFADDFTRSEPILSTAVDIGGDNDYDEKGRCIHHPQIRLRKKKLFGGWKVLMKECPYCLCIVEMRKNCLRGKGGNDIEARTCSKGAKEDASRKKLMMAPRMTSSSNTTATSAPVHPLKLNRKLDSSNRGGGQNCSSWVSRKDIVKSNGSSDHGKGKGSSAKHNTQEVNHDVSSLNAAPRTASTPLAERHTSKKDKSSTSQAKKDRRKHCMHVIEMKYTDVNGCSGLYSGTVNGKFVPHGHGEMLYDDGAKVEGKWKDGEWRRTRGEGRGRADERGGGGRRGSAPKPRRSESKPAAGPPDEPDSSTRSAASRTSSGSKPGTGRERGPGGDGPESRKKKNREGRGSSRTRRPGEGRRGGPRGGRTRACSASIIAGGECVDGRGEEASGRAPPVDATAAKGYQTSRCPIGDRCGPARPHQSFARSA